jgi:hypothetical protein
VTVERFYQRVALLRPLRQILRQLGQILLRSCCLAALAALRIDALNHSV